MDLQKIEPLLEKYFEAKTSLLEEKMLKTFFSANDLPEQLLAYKELFTYYNLESDNNSGDLELTSKFENPALKIIATAHIPKNNKNYWSHAAAVAILMVSTFFPARQYYQQQQAKIAYTQTIKAFSLLANNYKKATAPTAYLNEFEIAKTKIYKP